MILPGVRWQIAIQEYRSNIPIVQIFGNIERTEDGLSRWPLPDEIENSVYVPEEASAQIPTEGISDTDLNTTLFEEVTVILSIKFENSIPITC
ncbi:hypothetical protein O181_008619 [Austropuccinia psidii MF-1]|uniref:Uncharacterized protein n=1 Tax=Austropuccinia psidii MF-1 TaxID=1389203 RepID=A0A9Q3BP76_9BASI|nr:hypothetical protein [Austropuccinia psidii MF-1]